MKQQQHLLLGAINKVLLLFLLSPTTTNSQQFHLQQKQQQSYLPSTSYNDVIHLQRIIQSLPRTFDPTNPRDTCYIPLYNSDINNDGLVSIDEYPIFIEQLSNGIIDIPNFSNLPFVLQVNFVYLNCLCPNDLGGDECCVSVNGGGISTAGTGPGETPTQEQREYLTVVCSDTQASVDYAIEMGGLPTRSPTTLEEPTVKPTDVPTTMSPTTLAPVTMAPTTAAPVTNAPVTNAPTTNAPTTNAPTTNPPTTMAPVTAAPTTTAPSSSPVITPVTTNAPTIATENPTTKLPTITGQPTLSPSIFVDVPTTSLLPTSIEVPTTSIKPTGPIPTPTTPSPTTDPSFQQPSLQPSTAGGPNNPGNKPDNGNTTFEPIAPGAVAGIVLACVGVALVGVMVTRKRKRDGDDDPSLGDLSDGKDRDLEAGEVNGGHNGGRNGSNHHLSSQGSPPKGGGDLELANIKYVPETGNYVPQTIEPSPPSDPTLIPMVAGMPSSPRSSRKHVDSSNDDSSSAGASGWSSSAGISSLNTGSLHEASSFDTGMDDALSTGSPVNALATVAAASAVVETTRVTQDDSEPVFIPLDGSQSTDDDDDVSSPNGPVGIHSTPQGEVSRADLDMAIAAGDWAAVGATAALLAGTSKTEKHGQEDESGSKMSSSISRDDNSSISREELDELVAAGNWKGVVLAASNMDEDMSQGSGSVEEDSSGDSKEERDISEIRSEVVLLVKRVVPDELDNVDEMMLQFKGREEELVETLRTMQERTVAQRARQAVRKSAKMEAKARAMENRDEQRNRTNSLSSEDPSFYDDSEDDSSVSDLNSHSQSTSFKTTMTSLEQAVQQGNWLAVGEAAAMMGGVGIPPADFGSSETSSYIETDSMHDSELVSDSMHDSSLAGSTASSDLNKETRITHLDDLIAKGDWSGIVAAAGKYQAIDEQQLLGQASEEELEALAEANMWKTIATHSKESTDESAAAATNWAISRSLEQIEKNGAASGSDQSV